MTSHVADAHARDNCNAITKFPSEKIILMKLKEKCIIHKFKVRQNEQKHGAEN